MRAVPCWAESKLPAPCAESNAPEDEVFAPLAVSGFFPAVGTAEAWPDETDALAVTGKRFRPSTLDNAGTTIWLCVAA
jgi:hypothetical protein